MGWLDANEYFVMEAVARDRIDDLRAVVDPGPARDDDSLDTPRDRPAPGRAARGRGELEICRPRDRRAAFAGAGYSSSAQAWVRRRASVRWPEK